MDNSFFIYIERLVLIAFFSGYPLLYFAVHFLGEPMLKKGIIKINLVSLLPVAYAIAGILYLGLQLKNLYPDYTFENIKLTTSDPYLKIWALLSLLFFIPYLAKKPVLSLLHSLVFFYFIVRDFFLHFLGSADNNVLQNDMRMYTKSLLINLGAYALTLLLYFLYTVLKKRKTVN